MGVITGVRVIEYDAHFVAIGPEAEYLERESTNTDYEGTPSLMANTNIQHATKLILKVPVYPLTLADQPGRIDEDAQRNSVVNIYYELWSEVPQGVRPDAIYYELLSDINLVLPMNSYTFTVSINNVTGGPPKEKKFKFNKSTIMPM